MAKFRKIGKHLLPFVFMVSLFFMVKWVEFKGIIHSINFNMDIDGAVLLTPIDDADQLTNPNYRELGGFGARYFEHLDERLTLVYSGFPDVLDDYKLTSIRVNSGPYSVYGLSIGDDMVTVQNTMTSSGYEEIIGGSTYYYRRGKLVVSFRKDYKGLVESFYIEVESTNKDDVVF